MRQRNDPQVLRLASLPQDDSNNGARIRHAPGAREVLRFGFEELGLGGVVSFTSDANTRSRRVMEKLGMRTEGVALGYLEINGEWEDHVRYAMTAEEWRVRGPELKSTWLKRN